jgi:hypothetical protein
MKRMWAVSHPSQKANPRSSQACAEPEQETRDDGETFGFVECVYCQGD